MDTTALGWAAVRLGAGRRTKGEAIDPAVGFVMPVQVGDRLPAGAVLATVHANDPAKLAQAQADILAAIEWTDQDVPPLPHLYETVQG